MPKETKIKQTYRTAWESLPDFKGWLKAVADNPNRAYCTVCNKTLYAHRLSLLQHMCTVKHTKQAQMKFIENEQGNCDKGQNNTAAELLTQEAEEQNVIATELMTLELEGQHDTTTELVTLEVESSAIDLNNFENPDINSSEDEAPNLYINSVTTPLPHVSQYVSENGKTNAELPTSTHIRDTPRGTPVASLLQTNALPPISTHVLDSSRGTPVASLHVSLFKLTDGGWTLISDCVTNPVGRCSEFISREDFKPGRFKLHFDVDRYFDLRKQDYFFPFIEIIFDVRSPLGHYHVPLVLSPYGYSTYRGSW